jgi:hypothetical protein
MSVDLAYENVTRLFTTEATGNIKEAIHNNFSNLSARNKPFGLAYDNVTYLFTANSTRNTTKPSNDNLIKTTNETNNLEDISY